MTTKDRSSWLTAARVERLPIALRALRAHPPPGVAIREARRVVWRICGGPIDDVEEMLDLLREAGLVVIREGHFRITRLGTQVVTQDHQHNGRILARILIQTGCFTDQARRLGELWSLDENSTNLVCLRSVALAAAPQLVGVLRRFYGVTLTDRLVLPTTLGSELLDIWAVPGREDRDGRTAIGGRGELYTYRYEQALSSDATKVRWVSLDDDGLGYDIEDLNYSPRRKIEVKASSATNVRFFLSTNEWKVAHREAATYEIQFWGGIDLTRPEREEFKVLRAAGFPLVFKDLPAQLSEGHLVAEPWQYLVSGLDMY